MYMFMLNFILGGENIITTLTQHHKKKMEEKVFFHNIINLK